MKRLSKKQLRTIVGAYPWKPFDPNALPIGFEVYSGPGADGKFKVI